MKLLENRWFMDICSIPLNKLSNSLWRDADYYNLNNDISNQERVNIYLTLGDFHTRLSQSISNKYNEYNEH